MAPPRSASLIDAAYRRSFIRRFASAAALGFLLVSLIWLALLHRRLGFGYGQDIAVLSRLHGQLLPLLGVTGLSQVLGVGAVLLLLSLCWAHAVSGPLVRVRRWVRALDEEPPLETLRFRKSDQLHELADAFQDLGRARRARRERFEVLWTRAQRLLEECRSLKSGAEPAQLQKRLDALREVYAQMGRLIEEPTPGERSP